MADFEITVTRSGDSGTLEFQYGTVAVKTTCWWDPEVVIDANADGYVAYATQMPNKVNTATGKKPRPGIWLGKGIKYAYGTKSSNGIFIHEGKNAGWSDGCIVADRGEVMKIWNTISPKEAANVLVK